MAIDLAKFLEGPSLTLPKLRHDSDFESFLNRTFEDFRKGIDLLDDGNWVAQTLRARRPKIATLCAGIQQTVRFQFDGFPERAYCSLSETAKAIAPWLDGLGTKSNVSAQLTHLYRVRTGDLAGYDRRQLFHIPFEDRHKVRSQRFSIPGLPSLYLGGSLWICWEELNRPSFAQLHVARFKAVPTSSIRVLDFGFRPEVIASLAQVLKKDLDSDNENSNFILAHLCCWPLIAACSIKVMHPGAQFVPEYIIPQLMLQWIRTNNHFEGIRYFSTRPKEHMRSEDPSDFHHVTAESNYVFPAMTNRATGHCSELVTRFELSSPMAWQIAMSADFGSPNVRPGSDRWIWHAAPDLPIRYFKTHFSAVEGIVNSGACAPV